MSVFTGIHAASLRYQEGDADRLKSEVGAWCNSLNYLTSASLRRQAEWFGARALVAGLLKRVGVQASLEMDEQYGFPRLLTAGRETVYTSWTHTDDFLVAVIAPSPVGVDAERLDRSVEKVLPRVGSPEELRRLETQPNPGLALWVAKEAVAKASGLGMRWGLSNFEIQPPENAVWPVTLRQSGPRSLTAPAVSLQTREGCLIALSCERALLLKPVSWK